VTNIVTNIACLIQFNQLEVALI